MALALALALALSFFLSLLSVYQYLLRFVLTAIVKIMLYYRSEKR